MFVVGIVETLEAHVDTDGQRARHPFGASVERKRGVIEVSETRGLFARLGASERKQLIRQPHSPIRRCPELLYSSQDLRRVLGARSLLGVQLHGGERRTKLMG